MQEGSQFGPYQLIKRIAYGGMAEIHLAKTTGIRGFERLLALKVIHPKYSEDQEFIDMLIDEAKIAVNLNHSNLCRIFDLGRIESTYYIAMEFIDGKDLYQLLVRCSELDIQIPIDIAAFIALEMAAGLHYAHTQKDNYGRPLNVVHRDISPQNILLSYDGEVKIVDFGIAKASQRSKETESGVIKGKFFYMSPEQAWGHPIDGRTDIFSTGICLYEMLTGEMLYSEDKALVLLDKVRKAEIPDIRSRRAEVPEDLIRITLKALSRDRDLRYGMAEDLQRALTAFIYTKWPDFSRRRLVEFMRSVFGDQRFVLPLPVQTDADDFDISSGKSVIFDLNKMKHALNMGRAPSRPVAPPPPELDDFEDDDRTMAGSFQGGGSLSGSDEDERTLSGEPVWSGGRLPGVPARAPQDDDDETALIGNDAVSAARALPEDETSEDGDPPTAVFQKGFDLPPTQEQRRVPPPAPPPQAPPPPPPRTPPRPRQGAPAPAPAPAAPPARPAPARVETPRPPPGRTIQKTAALDTLAPSLVQLKKPSVLRKLLSPLGITLIGLALVVGVAAVLVLPGLLAPAEVKVVLKVTSVPPGAEVTFDGRFLGKQTPMAIPDLLVGTTHQLVLDLKGYERQTEEVNIPLDLKNGADVPRKVFMKKLGGILRVTSQPTGAEVYLDGKYVGETPVEKKGIDRERPEVSVLLRKDGFIDERAVLSWGQEVELKLDKKLKPRGR